MNELDSLTRKLNEAYEEIEQLKTENDYLKSLIHAARNETLFSQLPGQSETIVTNKSSPQEKVALFRSLFGGRTDVFALRWVGKDGRSGYSPVCINEWKRGLCNKMQKGKCSACSHREYAPLHDQVIFDHLSGRKVLGVYPLLADETCWFLAVDFDKESWREDVQAFRETCSTRKVPVSIERSRSGNGAHAWIFFATPIPAALARTLGCALLTKTMEHRHQVSLDSYDRLFPNQDHMPKGGLGNLIALPLQREARQQGNSVFVAENYEPFADQWLYLSQIKKMSQVEVEELVKKLTANSGVLGELKQIEENEAQPWETAKKELDISPADLPQSVRAVTSNMIYIESADLPQAMLYKITRLAAFANPEYYRARAMRMATYDKPRVINLSEIYPQHLAIPRGCRGELEALLTKYGITLIVEDKTNPGALVDAEFVGELTSLQHKAGVELMHHDCGVLCATTAFGKTVLAAWLISQRKTNALVIVHRRQLLDQWKERLQTFLNISANQIGEYGGGRDRRTGIIDVALIQSLNRKGEIQDFVRDYGLVIVDECHHISAFSFEEVLKTVTAKYVYGLTATAVRKDGHHPIVTMQCGPIRFRVGAKTQAALRPFEHLVIPRYTAFQMPEKIAGEWTIQEIYHHIIEDEPRNDLIFNDILHSLEEGRSPILLTERTAHLEYLARRLEHFAKNIIVFKGGMGKRQRQEVYNKLAAIPDDEERIILATGRYIGEGFDDARLDTLFLVMPISWKGTLQQYAGRLHRHHANKKEVRIYDYVDRSEPMLARMYQKRLKGYEAMGYRGSCS